MSASHSADSLLAAMQEIDARLAKWATLPVDERTRLLAQLEHDVAVALYGEQAAAVMSERLKRDTAARDGLR